MFAIGSNVTPSSHLHLISLSHAVFPLLLTRSQVLLHLFSSGFPRPALLYLSYKVSSSLAAFTSPPPPPCPPSRKVDKSRALARPACCLSSLYTKRVKNFLHVLLRTRRDTRTRLCLCNIIAFYLAGAGRPRIRQGVTSPWGAPPFTPPRMSSLVRMRVG